MRISTPRFCNAEGKEPLTSAKPPVLISGKTSELTNKTFLVNITLSADFTFIGANTFKGVTF